MPEDSVRHAEETIDRLCESFTAKDIHGRIALFQCPLMSRGVATRHLEKIFVDYAVNGSELTEEDREIRKSKRIYK